MELKYKRTYAAKNRRYSVGEIPVMLGYAMEIVEPRPKLSEGKLNPGEICMILFGLTPEEHAWKDGSERSLDELEAQLRKQVPADRLLGFRICDLKGAPVSRHIKLELGGSIDNGAFVARVKEKLPKVSAGPLDQKLLECRRLQKLCADKNAPEGVKADWARARQDLGAALTGLESIFVAYDRLMQGCYPSLGFDGRVEIFTLRTRAENAQKQVATAHAGHDFWQIREIPKNEMDGFFGMCASTGMQALRVDNGFAAAELTLKDFREPIPAQNADLRGLVLREIQYGLRWNSLRQDHAPEKNVRGALESMLTLRNFAWRSMGNAVLYALCAVPEGTDGKLCTAAAREKLGGGADLQVIGGERCVLIGEKQTGKQMLAVFTGEMQAVAFGEQVPGNARPVAMTFDELALRAQVAEGMLVDPASISYRVPKTEFAKLQDLRNKPPMIVRVKSSDAEENAEDPAPRVQSDMGELPNPDQFVQAAKPEKMENDQEAVPVADDGKAERQQKKGFFRKLFRK